MDGLGGVTSIETRTPVTLRTVVPLIPVELFLAVMVVVPGFLLVAMPPLAIDATFVSDEFQDTELVRSWVRPSL